MKLQTFGDILEPLWCFQVQFDPLLERVQTHIPPAALGVRVWTAPHVPVICSKISGKMLKTFLQVKTLPSGKRDHYMAIEPS